MPKLELSMAPCLITGKRYHNLSVFTDQCIDCHKSWIQLWRESDNAQVPKEPVHYTLKRRGEV